MSKAIDRSRIIKTASLIALIGNAALAALKIAAGLAADSLAVLGDGIDSSADVVVSVMALVVAGVISRPADEEHPWGHGRAETVATTILAFVLFFAGGQLVMNALGSSFPDAPRKFREQRRSSSPPSRSSEARLGMEPICPRPAGGLGDAHRQRQEHARRRSNLLGSPVGTRRCNRFPVPAADEIVAILVGCWVLKSAVGIFMEANMELMDGSTDQERYQALFDAVRSVPEQAIPTAPE
jgi:divalent metal cation (Fe/Co/Zn/Cd) transporter